MREIKFRAWFDTKKKMVYELGFDNNSFKSIEDAELMPSVWDLETRDENGTAESTYNYNIMQYTGLKDNTSWEKLTENEKLEFYNANKSQDGRTIKYQTIDDVKHLWNGKEIYEGDKLRGDDDYDFLVVVYSENKAMFMLDYYEHIGAEPLRFEYALDDFMEHEVIGNIHENPELMEV